MKKICPNPQPWNKIFQSLSRYSEQTLCNPKEPPKPLILAGWNFSSDLEKELRWDETKQWALNNNCTEIIEDLGDNDFYYA